MASGRADVKGIESERPESCTSSPAFNALASEANQGGLNIEFSVSTACPAGATISARDMRVTLRGGAAYDILASGSFDFSDEPLRIPTSGVAAHLVFPAGAVFASASEVADGIADGSISASTLGAAPSAGQVQSSQASSTSNQTIEASASGLAPKQQDAAALAGLKRLADQDEPTAAELEGFWTPQLSSKDDGTAADGITYSYGTILEEHLRLRQLFAEPGVRLVNSTDWGSFEAPNYWVTLVDMPSPRPSAALAFCRDEGFDSDHCYAKRLMRDGPASGNTRLQS